MIIRHTTYPTVAKPVSVKGVPLLWWVVVILLACITSLVMSLFFGGFGYLFGGFVVAVLWVYGFVMARKDPEFAMVWYKKRVSLKDTKNLNGTRSRRYEP
jgi:uncharacterized RDD family membrane protein YckC